MPDFTIKQGDISPVLTDQLTYSDGSHPDLTDKRVDLLIQLASGKHMSFEAQVVGNPELAELEYHFSEADTADHGEGLFSWRTEDGETFPTKGFNTILIDRNVHASGLSFFAPSTKDVATVLLARTADKWGNILGDFTDQTLVTYDQAMSAIEDAVDEVVEAVGVDIPADAIDQVRRLTKLLAAANIEMSFFPDQSAQSGSMYDKIMARVADLKSQVESSVAEEEISTGSNSASGAFPVSQGWERKRW